MDEEFDDVDFLAQTTSNVQQGAPERATSNPSGVVNRTGVQQPVPQDLKRKGPSAILVSTRQKGNPILNYVKGVPWEYSDIPADYVLGATTCGLFLSLKYHRLHPEYIYSRIRQLGKLYNLRVLLCMVDIENHEEALKELSKTSMINNLTLVLSWSAQEAGRYLELFKSYEHASPSSIRARQAVTYSESVTEFITTPRNINKTDAASLISNFGSLKAAVNAQPEELALIPGWGEKKVKSWATTVREPFRVKKAGKSASKLFRQESTMTAIGDEVRGEDATLELHSKVSLNPIPIGRAPAISREGTAVRTASPSLQESRARENAGDPEPLLHGQKRSQIESATLAEDIDDLPNIDPDEEAALLAAAEAESLKPEPLSQAQRTKPNDPELSAGVAAALAKYRAKS